MNKLFVMHFLMRSQWGSSFEAHVKCTVDRPHPPSHPFKLYYTSTDNVWKTSFTSLHQGNTDITHLNFISMDTHKCYIFIHWEKFYLFFVPKTTRVQRTPDTATAPVKLSHTTYCALWRVNKSVNCWKTVVTSKRMGARGWLIHQSSNSL